MSNTTFKQGIKNMDDLIKRSNGLFQKTLLLVLIPVLMINCYIFYMAYGGEGLDYTQLQSVDFNSVLAGNQEAMSEFSEALSQSFPEPSTKTGVADYVLEFIDIIAIVFLDAFIIILGTSLLNEKKLSASLISKLTIETLCPFFNLFKISRLLSLSSPFSSESVFESTFSTDLSPEFEFFADLFFKTSK